MKTAAVICEYNPFHNGHKYQIQMLKQKLNVDYVIALMSGDYVQRGEPAIFSKEERAKIALDFDIDLVLQLPLFYATGPSDLFALGAVSLLNRLNCVDYLVFGATTENIKLLSEASDAISKEGTIESLTIRECMKNGATFAKARALQFPEYQELLSDANNILAINYLQALKETNSTITPIAIKRTGSSYNDEMLPVNHTYASATAIRNSLYSNDNIDSYLPYSLDKEKIIRKDDFSMMLYYALVHEYNNLEDYFEMSHDLANKIRNNLPKYENWSQFCTLLKSKELTMARINRSLLHIMLNVKGTHDDFISLLPKLSAIRVLGINRSHNPLKEIEKDCTISLITKLFDQYEEQNNPTKDLLNCEIFASSLYNQINQYPKSEFEKRLITK